MMEALEVMIPKIETCKFLVQVLTKKKYSYDDLVALQDTVQSCSDEFGWVFPGKVYVHGFDAIVSTTVESTWIPTEWNHSIADSSSRSLELKPLPPTFLLKFCDAVANSDVHDSIAFGAGPFALRSAASARAIDPENAKTMKAKALEKVVIALITAHRPLESLNTCFVNP